MMSLLDRQKVPYSPLIDYEEDKFDFEEAIAVLNSYSLVVTNDREEFCQMHSLVGVAVSTTRSGSFPLRHESARPKRVWRKTISVSQALDTIQSEYSSQDG